MAAAQAVWRQSSQQVCTRVPLPQPCCWPAGATGRRVLRPWHCHSHAVLKQQPRRPVPACRFMPFGRTILDSTSAITDSSESEDGTDFERDTQASLANESTTSPSSGSRAGPYSPYSLFTALFYERINSHIDHALDVAAVYGLWRDLTLQDKIEVYQALLPVCEPLYNDTSSSNLLERLRNTLPASSWTVVERHLVDCMQRHLAPQEVGSQRTAGQQGQDSRIPPAVSQRMEADELNITALARTLRAAGLICQGSGWRVPAASNSPPLEPGMLAAPEVRLVTHLRAPQQPEFAWSDFMGKCRMAWDVFFPAKQALTPAGAMRARLKMVLVSDRSGLDLPTLIRIRNQSLAALAKAEGWDNLSELELQVASTRGNGEQVMALPLSQMPSPFMLRDADDYDYEYDDDDDYSDTDNDEVPEVAEGLMLDTAGQAQVSSQ